MRLTENTVVFATLIGWLKRGASALRAIGPYAAIELLLPGGSLMALALWLVQLKIRKNTPMRVPMKPCEDP
jgi:hypothetical protein